MSKHPRIGIFLCECGGEISSRVDLEDLAARVQGLPGVVHVAVRPFWCSPDGLAELRKQVSDGQLDRIVVGGCSPRTHGALLWSQTEEAGLNWNFCQIVNLREHCARVHPGDVIAATAKAHRLLRMGIAAAAEAESVARTEVEITPVAAVIGGGIAGITAAVSLAHRGVSVKLIEQETDLGGELRKLARIYPKQVDAGEFLRPRAEAALSNERIDVLTGARMADVRGHAGAFEVIVDRQGREETIPAGVVIFATGAREWVPEDRGGPNVILFSQLQGLLREGDLKSDRIAFILSADGPLSRVPEAMSLFGRAVLGAAGEIRQLRPGASLSILFQELPESSKEAAQGLFRSGARFVRYSHENPPRIAGSSVEVRDRETGERARIDADVIVMATGLAPSEGTLRAGEIPLLWRDENGFLIEPYLRLKPGEVFDRGVYVAGTAHGPAGVAQSMAQAMGAASRALGFLRSGKITKRSLVAVVDEEVCRGCGRCEEVCAFGAARLRDREQGVRRSVIDEVLCVGCGFCVSECISGAIRLPQLTDRQVRAILAGAVGF